MPAGPSPRLLAERHGLSERNVRRRAAAEAWSRSAGCGPADPEGALADDPALEAFVTARKVETNELLLRPTRTRLSRFAFRRATEAAALGRPAEASGWLRLVDQLRRNARAVDEPEQTWDPADLIRARYAETLMFGDFGDEPDEAAPAPSLEAGDGR
jgi:hypothetical protein